MVTIKKKQFFFTITENLFEYKFKWTDLFLPVCYRGLRETNQQFYFGTKKYTKTIVLPLHNSIETTRASFSTTLKYDIKKGESEGIQCYFNKDIKVFFTFYNEFAKRKNLHIFDTSRMEEFNIPEWKCSFAVFNGDILVAHSYLEDKESGIVRLMESGSVRLNNQHQAKLIAYANKFLHYHDIKYFTEQGLQFYDFGGWDDLPGLLAFKQSFGAYPINVFNFYTYPYTLKEKIKELAVALKKK